MSSTTFAMGSAAAAAAAATGAARVVCRDALGRNFHSSSPRQSAIGDAFHSLAPALQALPPTLAPYLPGPLAAYPISTTLVLLTITLRTAVTLPAALWQRARTRRMATEVVPVWEQMKKELPLQVRARSRRAGKSYEEFNVELEAEMKKSLRDLLRKHKCTPLPTMLVPLAVQIPLFITLSYLIRESALTPEFAQELLPWSTWSFSGPSAAEQAQLDAFAQSASILRDRGMNEETLAQIMGPRGAGGGLGTTLAQKDSSMEGPIALGMITLLNAELNAYRSSRERQQFEETPDQAQPTTSSTQAQPVAPASIPARRDYRLKPPSPKAPNRPPAPPTSPARSPSPAARQIENEVQRDDKAAAEAGKTEQHVSLRTTIFTNTLRVAAIAFVPIASQVPGGLLVYWLSSACYTLGQNALLDWRDRRLK
ncbi:hypothetical protein V8E36_004129 [Tilletia maclaganii]